MAAQGRRGESKSDKFIQLDKFDDMQLNNNWRSFSIQGDCTLIKSN